MTEVKFDVEALLFASGRAMQEEQLASILDTEIKTVQHALKALQKEYSERESALTIYEEKHTWKMLVRDLHLPVVQRVVADTELSRATLETLAIIAYNHPNILQSEVVHTRGSVAYDHIKELEAAGFIARVPEGRSFKIKLSEKFFEYFDVEGSADIREVFKDVVVPEKVVAQQTLVSDTHDANGVQKSSDGDGTDEENPFMTRDLGTKPELTEEERNERNAFFAKLDAEIGEVTSRNDSHDSDKLITRLESSGLEEPLDDESADNTDTRMHNKRTEEIFGDEDSSPSSAAEALGVDDSDDDADDADSADVTNELADETTVEQDTVDTYQETSAPDPAQKKKSALDDPLDVEHL